MSETKAKEQKARESCIYRVFTPLMIGASGQWIQGKADAPVIADLSDVGDVMIRWLLDHHMIESADGEPVNKATGAVKRKPCPCANKE